ncbi:MAG: hypothetical protein AB1813_23915, partial [Verrucomicrobiota bacterium]
MNATPAQATPATFNPTVRIVRWIARILSVLIILFWGYFIVAHLLGGGVEALRPVTWNDSVQLWMMLLWLFGLAVAWRWELVGAVAALTGALIGALLNPNAVGLIFV